MTSKSFKIHLSDDIALDARTLVDTRALIAGSSGSGKSYCMRVIAEQAARKLQTIVIDPEGEYTTLREKVDVFIVSCDRDGDVVPTVATAAKLARKLLELQVGAVIDLYGLKIQERRAFVRHFLDSLMTVPKKLWHPCLVMIDEAHKLCPEKSSGQAESTDAVITLLSQGRKRGFCGIRSTQRLQKLHKDAAAETLNNLIGRTSLDIDVRRARDILGLAKADEAKLRRLKAGNWYGFGPAFVGVDGVCQFKVQEAATTHPQPGNRHTLRAPAPSARIKKVLPELAELPQVAEQEAKDLESMRVRVRELEKDLRTARKGSPAPVKLKVNPEFIKTQVNRALAKQSKEYDKILTKVGRQIAKIQDATIVVADAAQQAQIYGGEDVIPFAQDDVPENPPRRETPQPSESRPGSNGALGGGMRRMVLALASSGGAPRSELAVMSRMAPTSGTFSNYLSKLKKQGYIDDEGGDWIATVAGVEDLGNYTPIPTRGHFLIAAWRDQLGSGGVRRIFDALAEAGSSGMSRVELANEAGLESTSGTFSNYLSKLKRKGLVTGSWPRSLVEVFFR